MTRPLAIPTILLLALVGAGGCAARIPRRASHGHALSEPPFAAAAGDSAAVVFSDTIRDDGWESSRRDAALHPRDPDSAWADAAWPQPPRPSLWDTRRVYFSERANAVEIVNPRAGRWPTPAPSWRDGGR